MSALGQNLPFSPGQPNVRFAPKAVIRLRMRLPLSLNENGGMMAAVAAVSELLSVTLQRLFQLDSNDMHRGLSYVFQRVGALFSNNKCFPGLALYDLFRAVSIGALRSTALHIVSN